MNGNPYYINPLGGAMPQIGQNLAGIAGIIGKENRDEEALKEMDVLLKEGTDSDIARFAMTNPEMGKRLLEQKAAMKKSAALEKAKELYKSGDINALAEFAIENPEVGKTALAAIGVTREEQKRELEEDLVKILTNPDNAEDILVSRINRIEARGGDPSDSLKELGLLRTDPKKFLATNERAFAVMQTRKDDPAWKNYMELMHPELAGKDDKSADAVKSVTFNNGVVLQAVKKGTPLLYNVDGTPVAPADRKAVLEEARKSGVTEAGDIAYAKTAGDLTARLEKEPTLKRETAMAEANVKVADDAFKRVAGIRENMSLLQEVVDTVKSDNTQTGALRARLPSITQAATRLDNLQFRLGLNVIQNTTFGALSEGELKLALDTALPTKLEAPELVKWAEARIAAQNKLANYLESYASYLERGGKKSEWFSAMKAKQPPKTPGEKPIAEKPALSTAPEVTSSQNKKTVTTAAEYDVLPVGTTYVYNGIEYTKGK
ncbi:MAG: hypothetical protein HGA87_00985 [Desulfobulbaceae bacterium]|nr:hypothetical protein [Desulfobulbaceae bacterium]